MNLPVLKFLLPVVLMFLVSGCSIFSKEKKAAAAGEQMRISAESAVFQPLVRRDVLQSQSLQAPLISRSVRRQTRSDRPFTLPRFTAVKVLSNNGKVALVEIQGGQRGFVAAEAIATESSILAVAPQATRLNPAPVDVSIDPATGLPYDLQGLYLPQMDAADAPVDQALLNQIDSIPLPESEQPAVERKPEAQYVDGVLIRNPEGAQTPEP